MKAPTFMLIAGEASGDLLAAELVAALREHYLSQLPSASGDVQPLHTALPPRFFGAGGPKLDAAGVDVAFDLTQHSVIGVSEVLKNLGKFRRLFHQLFQLAIQRQPDVIIGVDYGGFNLRFAGAIRKHARAHQGQFAPWQPKLVQFVSPQVWASRPSRAYSLAANHDLLLSIFPFERPWYAQRVPSLRVEFVGHPLLDRLARPAGEFTRQLSPVPSIVLLPGSRKDEVRRHLPIVLGAYDLIRRAVPAVTGRMILPDPSLIGSTFSGTLPPGLQIQSGGLHAALAAADLAITKSGTVTMECAAHGVPAVVFYKTSWPTYWIAKKLVSVRYLAMPNLLADAEIYPEFIQQAATPEAIANAGIELLRDGPRRAGLQLRLSKVIGSLGGPGATQRAAKAILSLIP